MDARTPQHEKREPFDREALNRSLDAAIEEAERYGYVSAEESERRVRKILGHRKR